MARKSRTPPPPRRVQVPMPRKDARTDRRMLWLLLGALAVAAAVGAGAFFLLRGDGGGKSLQATMEEADCTLRRFDLRPAEHIEDENATPKEWNSFPPTSGPHFGTAVIWGEYEEPVQLTRAVHNLEHGGIVMYYGDEVADADVDAVRFFYRADPVAMVLAPLPRLGDKIALTAWFTPLEDEEGEAGGYLAECARFDEDAFEAFRDEFRFHGPERFAPADLEPGE